MKLLVFGDLMEKINKEYDVSRMTAYSMASKIVNKCPKRLYINIMEWIEGEGIDDGGVEEGGLVEEGLGL